MISIAEPELPTLISMENPIIITAGEDLHNKSFFSFIGKNLTYTLLSSIILFNLELPEGISMSYETGVFNGYTLNEFYDKQYTLIVSNKLKEVKYTGIIIKVIIGDKPIIVESTLPRNTISVEAGSSVSFYIFRVAGRNIKCDVNPGILLYII